MNIGFDLDNIFINNPPFIPNFVISKLYRKRTNGILEYRIPSQKEQLIRILSHYPLFRPAIKKNLQFLYRLPKENHKLFLISSRYGFLKSMTNKIVNKYKLDMVFDKLYFNTQNKQPHIFKSEIVSKLKLDVFVDDDLHLLKYISGKNNHTMLYWLNKKLDNNISNNIKAITNLTDILEK
jgi:hypothetical protein